MSSSSRVLHAMFLSSLGSLQSSSFARCQVWSSSNPALANEAGRLPEQAAGVLWRAGETENVGVVQGELWWLPEADLCLSNLQLCPPRSDGCSLCEPISLADSDDDIPRHVAFSGVFELSC